MKKKTSKYQSAEFKKFKMIFHLIFRSNIGKKTKANKQKEQDGQNANFSPFF